MIKFWLVISVLTVNGSSITDVTRSREAFDDRDACETARVVKERQMQRERKQFIATCKADV
jgi:hypothetical protein